MLIEIHMIQNHSPSNLNRDDLGAPKTCVFGGATRARISSQCIKRSLRNPGNIYDVHNTKPGIFAEAMQGFVGIRTRFFPWLVQKCIENEYAEIPSDEKERIVHATQGIATTKEKGLQQGADERHDTRPRTPQLIHIAQNHAKSFLEKLLEVRKTNKDLYDYFLNPIVAFEQMVRDALSDSSLPNKEQEKIIKNSWIIANCRMDQLDPDGLLEKKAPGVEEAEFIVEKLSEMYSDDRENYKKLTKPATTEEKSRLKENQKQQDEAQENKQLDKKKKELLEELKGLMSCDAVDIALFGRMTTSEAFDDVEAAMQVAHAISTHEIINEVDYWTAVDDLGVTGGGAGHVGEAMFNSACFYKYFCLDWDQLIYNLAGSEPDQQKDPSTYDHWKNEIQPAARKLAARTLGHFIRGAAFSTPSGKQNSFAAHNEPCGILVEIKKAKIPTSYANAFAEPVVRIGPPEEDGPDETSLEGRSVARLAEHVQAIRSAYSMDSELFWYSPKLWRYPFKYWTRSEDGKKDKQEVVTPNRFSRLIGEGENEGLIDAVVKAVGFEWSEIDRAIESPQKGA